MRRWRARQRGIAAIFAAIAASACLIAVALVVDIGRLYSAQRDLQRLANLSALDASRIAGGCMGIPSNPQSAAYNEVADSVVRNGGRSGAIVIDSVLLGRQYDAPEGVRKFVVSASGQINNAVQVELSRPMPSALLPFARAGGGTLRARAAARSRPEASVSIGTRLAEVDPEFLNKFLSAALGGPVKLDALGYTSLLDAQLPLEALIDQLGDGDPEILFEPVDIPGLLHATADALNDTGQRAASAVASQLADVATASAVILPSELVALERDLADAVGSSLINVGELTIAAAQAVTQSSVVAFSYGLPPPLGDSQVMIRIVNPAQLAPALAPTFPGEDAEPQFASNAQGLLQTDFNIDLAPLGVSVRLPLWFELAEGTAQVTDIECAREGQPQDRVKVLARTSVSRLGIGEFDDITAPQPKAQPAALVDADFGAGLLGIPLPVHVRITAMVAHDIDSGEDELTFQSPFDQPPQQVGGSLELKEALTRLPAAMDVKVDITPIGDNAAPVLSGLLDPALDAVLAAAQETLEAALRTRLADRMLPMTDALSRNILSGAGLAVGNADVQVYDVRVAEPYLFTH